MEKKARSRPMSRILSNLCQRDPSIEVVVFEEDCILYKDVEDWPQCDFLIAFHSDGFPLEKTQDYHRLRKPVLLCNLERQFDILDRRKVLNLLRERDIPFPETFTAESSDEVVQNGDELTFKKDGHTVGTLRKPFIEKPICSEDHNVWLYYPETTGGGIRKLFRKTKSRSSQLFRDEWKIRRDGVFLYQHVHESAGNLDVKVYCIGNDYFYAECRKAPTVDGVVDRTAHGKERRLEIDLSEKEKDIARKVAITMEQYVCGFDLLRCKDGSFVIDVNGWSFVKGNEEYYKTCGERLADHISVLWNDLQKLNTDEGGGGGE